MKKFNFPLGRVMDWRRTLAQVEELKLERLYAELRGIDAREVAIREERTRSEKAVAAAPVTTGFELATLDAFRRFTILECTRLEKLRAECAQRIAAQIQVVAQKRRDLRLLERFKDQRLQAWRHDLARELDAQADEAYLAKWARASSPISSNKNSGKTVI